MTQGETASKDYWPADIYEAAASFVPRFADTLVQSIEFNPTDRILDIGCGNGKFGTSFAPSVGYVMGIDSSPSMISTAKTLDYGGTATDFCVVDCRHLEQNAKVMNGNWDKVLHLQRCPPLDFERPVNSYLHLGKHLSIDEARGNVLFEMCGHGNVPEMTTSFMFALVNHGVPIETAEALCPWFYPSDDHMKMMLEQVGFRVDLIALNPQPLKMTTSEKGGLEGFLRLLGSQMLDILDTDDKKNSAMEQICRMLRYGTTREDGSQWSHPQTPNAQIPGCNTPSIFRQPNGLTIPWLQKRYIIYHRDKNDKNPTMAQILDLGQFTLQIRDSTLQLHLAAWAHFYQPASHGCLQAPMDFTHLPNFEDIWITEAPELTLRFFIGSDWDGKEAERIALELKENLCDMKIWSDLGFLAEVKEDEHGKSIETSGFHYIKVGLRKDHQIRSVSKGWTLPNIMINAPDVCPPPGVAVTALGSIDVRLEYCFHLKHPPHPQALETTIEQGLPAQMHGETFLTPFGSHISQISEHTFGPSCDEPLRLFELGIQTLLASNPTKVSMIRISKPNTMKALADLTPAVFNPEYREAINQRGVTIPVITKAITAMLSRNENPSIKAGLTNLLPINSSLHINDPTVQSDILRLRSAVHTSLWRVARQSLPTQNPTKRRGPKPSTSSLHNAPTGPKMAEPELSIGQHQSDGQSLGALHHFGTQYKNEENDECLLNSESEPESEGQLLDELSEIGFTEAGDSTQTSLDTLFSPIGSSQTSYYGHDNTMMFSSPVRSMDDEEDYMEGYDVYEDMTGYDTDIIMDDNL
ncbi:hypothetical protein N7457_002233 [Penicillium paradoxum]|uniref:uncharacterized protein n=1 Tax=Penicillium paradoxum TaxID=176176 RepID=UPI0025481FEF|nr:uncharacterized protein N7457_002233 [Penicillium paradoxum]KAJ5787243.1 hypothetical protein N7457_002233 [Penicillium paradoxum]